MQIYSVRFIPFCDNSRLPQKQGIISTSLMIILVPKIFQFRMQWRQQIFNKGSLQLGLALGIFSLLFKVSKL